MMAIPERAKRQEYVADWCARAFGVAHATNLPQRGLRHLEEAIELAQAVGAPRDKAHDLVDYIYDRPAGTIHQEIGGVSITLLALAAAAGIDADQAEADELFRILQKPASHFAARNQAKNDAGFNVVPSGSPEVGDGPPEPIDTCVGCQKPIYENDLAFHYNDGPTACRACAPTYADSEKELTESLEGCDDPEEFARLRQSLDNVRAHVAAGAGDLKHVW